MSNTVYENTVLETKLTELLNSYLDARALMTVDTSLAENAGLTKVINRYTYSGTVEALNAGASNTQVGSLTFVPERYTVKRYQQTYRYNDMDVMQDPALIDVAMEGMAKLMANQIRTEYFGELMRIRGRYAIAGNAVTYNDIVEALGAVGREVEDGLFLLMGVDGRTAIRKDDDFILAQQGQIVYSGQFGTICGVPVIFSKLVPAGMTILTGKDAVKFFVKREAGLEQSRDIEKKDNTVVYERHGLIALVDDSASVILGKAVPEMTASAAVAAGKITLTVTGTTEGNTVHYAFDRDAVLACDNVADWKAWDGSSTIDQGTATRISLAEADSTGKVVKSKVLTLA